MPRTVGVFSLDYYAVMIIPDLVLEFEMGTEIEAPAFDNKIEIPVPIPVPSLTSTGAVIAAGLLFLAAAAVILYRKRKWGRSSLLIILLALAVPCLALYLHALVPVYAEEGVVPGDDLPLSRENLQAFKDYLEGEGALAQDALSAPREVIEEFFALDSAQTAFLYAVSEKELEDVIQVLLDADDVGDMRCSIKNTDSQGLECWITEIE